MNYTLNVRFKKEEPPNVTQFMYSRAKNWLHLWVADVYMGGHPFTYTVEEALEDFCGRSGHLFEGISFVTGGNMKCGTYLWRRA